MHTIPWWFRFVAPLLATHVCEDSGYYAAFKRFWGRTYVVETGVMVRVGSRYRFVPDS